MSAGERGRARERDAPAGQPRLLHEHLPHAGVLAEDGADVADGAQRVGDREILKEGGAHAPRVEPQAHVAGGQPLVEQNDGALLNPRLLVLLRHLRALQRQRGAAAEGAEEGQVEGQEEGVPWAAAPSLPAHGGISAAAAC